MTVRYTSYKGFFQVIFISLLSFCCSRGFSQQVSEDTYRKAMYFLSDNIQKEVYHLEVIPNWIEGQNGFWHMAYTSEGKRFFYTDMSKKETQEAFDHIRLAGLLREQSDESVDPEALPFSRIIFVENSIIGFEWKNRKWELNTESYTLTEKAQEFTKPLQGLSPDKKWRAFTKDFNLFVEKMESGEVRQLSFHGKKDFEYARGYGWGDLMKGEMGNRPDRFTVNWSPDSKKIFTQIADFRLAEKMYLLDFSQDEKFRPELLSYYRGSPGDTTLVFYTPVIFDVETKEEIIIPDLKSPHFIGLNFRWNSDGSLLSGMYFHRGYKQMDFYEINPSNGHFRSLFRDSAETFVENTQFYRILSDDRMIISSERSGFKHLYLINQKDGKVIRQVTSGEYVVSRIHHIDEENGWIYFEANGKEKGRNVYYPHLYKVRLDGSGLTLLTKEDAYHDLHVSRDFKYVVDNYSKIDQPTRSVLRDLETGDILMEISSADVSNLEKRGYRSPKGFSAIGKDGKTEIFGVYFLPTDFNSDEKYPVIDYTYTGPFTATTPKTFKAALMGLQQPFAELGFVVVTVDGLGTVGRGKAFQSHSYRNLGDGTTDHVLAIQQLAEKVSFIDIDRVGIFGHSAGGYDAARAMLLHPDFYKVGVASAADHDHRMEKAWWPEMYMGYPVGDFYHEQSNVTNAANLKGRLLLAHGAMDENVNPSATYKLAEALIKANKDFDLFIWPSRNHSFGRTNGDYFTKKRWDYFIQHLQGKEPLLHFNIWD
jgi:dipeptidyl-peptidase-4